MTTRSAVAKTDVLLGALVAVALVVGVVALYYVGSWGTPAGSPPETMDDDLAKLRQIDPALIGYEQTGEFPVGLAEVHALAVGPDDAIYVGGDQAVRVFDSQGQQRAEFATTDSPRCLAVGGAAHDFPGRVYVGTARRIERFDAEGQPLVAWDDLGPDTQESPETPKTLLTSLALADHDVFAADAGNRVVWRYDTAGKKKDPIGRYDERRGIRGFAIPSPIFDVAVAPDGLLRVVNPGALRIEAYTFDGDLEQAWPRSPDPLAGFFGCCNPAHLAIFADGRCVTAEKSLPRIKVYTAQGGFLSVVSGPEQLNVAAADLAVDSRGRVLVLDPQARSVRIFEPKNTPVATQP